MNLRTYVSLSEDAGRDPEEPQAEGTAAHLAGAGEAPFHVVLMEKLCSHGEEGAAGGNAQGAAHQDVRRCEGHLPWTQGFYL